MKFSLFGSLVTVAREAQKESRRTRAPAKGSLLPHLFQNSEEQCRKEFDKFKKTMSGSADHEQEQKQETASKRRKVDQVSPDSIVIREAPKHDAEKPHQNPNPRIVIKLPPRYDAAEKSKSKKKSVKIEKSREEILKKERSLKKPMISSDDSNHETGQKKRKTDHNFEKKPSDYVRKTVEPLSEEVRMKMVQMALAGGAPPENEVAPVLVIQKDLTSSDTLRDQNRITLPLAQIENAFLSREEDEYLQIKVKTRTNYYVVPIIEPSGKVSKLNLRRWNVGKNSVSYVFNGNWKDVVAFNQLQEGQTVQLWAFRVMGTLNFAFVVLPYQKPGELPVALIEYHGNNNAAAADATTNEEDVESSTSRSRDSEMSTAVIDLNMDPAQAIDAC